ncbi:GTP-binding protein [Clostridium sediminicola]|uniref:CobW family GTP-binding protein n=1 Tax=Clostridium sediminicola TaxID=3114879 RepID=UPI0031F23F1C
MVKKRIKLYFITGFLGAGKTTFLNLLLKQFQDDKIGIVMNEFGSESVDGDRVGSESDELVEINNGAIFCSCLKGAFIDALGKMGEYPLDHVFVESSGIGDPSNTKTILELITKNYGDLYEYKGTIALVDSTNFLELVQVLPAVERQVKYSDFIVLNKVDLVDADRLEKIINKIKNINANVSIHKTSFCELTDEFWNSIKEAEEKKDVKISFEHEVQNKGLVTLSLAPMPSTNTPLNQLKTFKVETNMAIDKLHLERFIEELKEKFFRIKGDIFDGKAWYQVDLASSYITMKKTERKHEKSELILIATYETTDLDREEIEQLIKEAWEKNVQVNLEVQ